MFEAFYPSECAQSAYEIDYAGLRARGIRGLIFDIDNTLVPHGAPADEAVRELFARLRGLGFRTCLISNNKEPRVRPFADAVESAFVCDAHKPSAREYVHAMERMGTDRQSTVFVGDQLFTDIWGANRAGIESILVQPIHPKEEIQIVLKRYLERIVLCAYRRKQNAESRKKC